MTHLELFALSDRGNVHAATDNDLVDMLRSAPTALAEQDWPTAGAAIADLLTTSRSPNVRNAAALAMADMKYPRAGEAINSVLARPDVAPSAGTLIFALDEIDASVSLDAVVNIVSHGSYESRAELVMLLGRNGVSAFCPEEGRAAEEALSRIAAGNDSNAAEAAGLVLELFDSGS